MAHSLGVAMQGGNPLLGRKAHDFYATPEDVTLALYLKIAHLLDPEADVSDPACGDGALLKVLAARGHSVVGSDLYDRGYGTPHRDFRDMVELPAPQVITNPPFNLSGELIERVLSLRPKLFATLHKGTFWHAKTRIPLWRRYRPYAVYPLSWRPDFEGRGRPTLEIAWTVWVDGHEGPTAYEALERPPGYKNTPRPRKPKAVDLDEAGVPLEAKPKVKSKKPKAKKAGKAKTVKGKPVAAGTAKPKVSVAQVSVAQAVEPRAGGADATRSRPPARKPAPARGEAVPDLAPAEDLQLALFPVPAQRPAAEAGDLALVA